MELKNNEQVENETIEKLVCMPNYEGILKSDGNVQIPWNIGIDKVSLNTFLKGTEKYKQKRGECAFLQIPLPVPIFFYELARESIESKLKELEEKYPIHCFFNKSYFR